MNIDSTARQYRKPSGLRGYKIAALMEERNIPAYEWLLPRLEVGPRDKVLEVGFGTGYGLSELARRFPEAHLCGVDFSRVMCRLAGRKNREHVRAGRMRLDRGDILSYKGESDFDLVFCMNVVYFWKSLSEYCAALSRLLKRGGKLRIYMASPDRLTQIPHGRSAVFTKYTLQDVSAGLERYGFSNAAAVVNETPLGTYYLVTAVRS
jgi:trans-aconitate methyltransferase